MNDPIDQSECEQRQCQPDQNLLRDEHCVGGRHEHDRGRDESAEEHTQRKLSERRAPDRGNAFGQTGMMRVLFRRVRRQRQCLFVDVDNVVAGRASSERARDIAHEVRDPLLGVGLGGDGELLVVMEPMVPVAEYATGMIYKAQCFFDIALPVARFRIIFSDQATQRGPHFLVGGKLRNTERFVQRRFH